MSEANNEITSKTATIHKPYNSPLNLIHLHKSTQNLKINELYSLCFMNIEFQKYAQ